MENTTPRLACALHTERERVMFRRKAAKGSRRDGECGQNLDMHDSKRHGPLKLHFGFLALPSNRKAGRWKIKFGLMN